MKIHEFQGKNIFKHYGIPIQDGYVIDNLADASATIEKVQQEFNSKAVMVKAQIHAGGRGKGGGVKYCPTTKDALENVSNMLGMNLITPQTGDGGQKVRKVYITEALDIQKEYYCALTLDRAKTKDVFMVSSEGGVEIEKVAAETPEKIIKVWIDPLIGMKIPQARELAIGLGLGGEPLKTAITMFMKMYQCYVETDASLVEINPLVLTEDDRVVALDAKFNFDDNALYRQPDIAELHDKHEEDPTEMAAKEYNLNYIKLDGNVGCMVNGAGLAMGTMDIIKLYGGEPANFLDVGGVANAETVAHGFKIILSDPNVKSILINIFGGIVRCDRVAQGVIDAMSQIEVKIPIVIRLEGTNAKVASKLLQNSEHDFIVAGSLAHAAQLVVQAAKQDH